MHRERIHSFARLTYRATFGRRPKNSVRDVLVAFRCRRVSSKETDKTKASLLPTRSKDFDRVKLSWSEISGSFSCLNLLCFASAGTCSFKMWRNAPLRREPASPRRDQYSFTDTTNGLPGGGQARHKKTRATGQIVSLVLGQSGILNWTLQSCLDETCAPSRLVCPTNLSVNVESSKPLLDQLRQF